MNQFNTQEAKVALVTGGARRIGAAIVKQLHQAGYRIVIHCCHHLQEAHVLATELNQKCPHSAYVLARDFSEDEDVEEIIQAIQNWTGRLDLVVNNASVFSRTDCDQMNASNWELLFQVNVKIPFLLSLAARPLLTQHEGNIINITDVHAEKPLKGYSVYCQTKAALEMQTKSLARELAPKIRVNAIAPGAIAWPEEANCLSQEQQHKIIAKTPLKRHGQPEFVAQAVVALAENPFITGQIIKVDGGRSLS